jgi:hypothetical protein
VGELGPTLFNEIVRSIGNVILFWERSARNDSLLAGELGSPHPEIFGQCRLLAAGLVPDYGSGEGWSCGLNIKRISLNLFVVKVTA